MNASWEYLYLLSMQTYDSDAGWQRQLWIYHPGSDDPEPRGDFHIVHVLNEFGALGWELVAHEVASSTVTGTHTSAAGAYVPAHSTPRESRWVLKRQRDESLTR